MVNHKYLFIHTLKESEVLYSLWVWVPRCFNEVLYNRGKERRNCIGTVCLSPLCWLNCHLVCWLSKIKCLYHLILLTVYLSFCKLYLPTWWSDCICLSTLPRKYLRKRNTQFWFKCFSTYKRYLKHIGISLRELHYNRKWSTWCILNFSPFINLDNCWITLFIDS